MIVYFLIVFPGNFNYDIIMQQIAYKTGNYTTHYPPAYCFISGVIIDFGKMIFGSANGGIALYIIIQAVITNLVIAKVVADVSNRLKNKTFFIVSLLYFLIHPFVFNLMLSTCQDVFFADFFVLLLLELVFMAEDKDYFKSKKNWLKVFIFTFLMCIVRNNGLFALIPVVVLGVFFMKKRRIQFVSILMIPIIVFSLGYNILFLNLMNVNRQSLFHESLNVPVMQIGRGLYYNHDGVWSEELFKYFKEKCDWGAYGQHPSISDEFKDCFRDDVLDNDLFGFIKYWAKIGKKAPRQYIEAPGMLALGLYYPWTTYEENVYENSTIDGPYEEFTVRTVAEDAVEMGVVVPSRDTKMPSLHAFFNDFFFKKQTWSHIPGFRLIWCAAFSTFLALITLAFILYRKKSEYAIPVIFVFGMLMTVFLAPTVVFRYVFPVVLSTPILFYVIIRTIDSKSGEKYGKNFSNWWNRLHRLAHRNRVDKKRL